MHNQIVILNLLTDKKSKKEGHVFAYDGSSVYYSTTNYNAAMDCIFQIDLSTGDCISMKKTWGPWCKARKLDADRMIVVYVDMKHRRMYLKAFGFRGEDKYVVDFDGNVEQGASFYDKMNYSPDGRSSAYALNGFRLFTAEGSEQVIREFDDKGNQVGTIPIDTFPGDQLGLTCVNEYLVAALDYYGLNIREAEISGLTYRAGSWNRIEPK